MRKPRKLGLAIAGIVLLAAATLVVEGGRAFGSGKAEGLPVIGRGEGRQPASNAGGEGWLVAGPFKIEGLSGLEEALDRDYLAAAGMAPSGEAQARALRIGSDDSKLWRETGEGEGVDFIAELGDSKDSIAYAYRELEVSSSREAALKLGSDDGVKVWINGKIVLAHHVTRALLRDEDSVIVSLAKGRNRILVKVGQARGEWGFTLRFESLGAETAAASAEESHSIGAYPDDLAVPPGGTIRGAVMPKPSDFRGIGAEGRAIVELLDASGAVRAATDARIGGRFSLPLPQGLSGFARIRARGLGGAAGGPSPPRSILIGDPASSAKLGAALARSPSAAAIAASRFAEIPDPAATLELLAQSLEGSLPSNVRGFDLALQALAEIEALAGNRGGGSAFPRGLWRYAYSSGLDGSIQPYSLYLPKAYDRKGRYGLLVNLHGASGNDIAAAANLASAEPGDMLILAPFGRGDLAYTGAGERDVIDAVDSIQRRYAIDADRIYLSGSSMGGFGAWRLAKLYPWRFAAAVSFAGWTDLEMLENLISLPFLAVHGDADDVIPFEPDTRAVAFLASNGGRASVEILRGAGHNAFGAWTAEEGPERLFSWMRRFTRNPWPKSIKLRTTMARAGRGAWASILGIEKPPRAAAIDARIVDERHIAVETENVSAFELDLRHPGLAGGGRILIIADGYNLTADSGRPSARFELGPDGRFLPAAPPSGKELANGGSGLAALFDSPLRIVFGSRKKSRASDEIAVARALAEALGRGGIASAEILSDSEAEKEGGESDASVTIFVGSPDDNSALAALAPKLPIAWKEGRYHSPDGKASGPGLILVCPDPRNKGRLTGVLSVPLRGQDSADFVVAMLAPMNRRASQATCGFGTPDAIIVGKSGSLEWMGYFDWRWERLKAVVPEKK